MTAPNCISPGTSVIDPLREALEEIVGLTAYLRQGGPDPMDLQGLSDALDHATSLAHAALAVPEDVRAGVAQSPTMMPISRDIATIEQTAHVIINQLTNENLRYRKCISWIETWVSNSVGSYSVSALDGLFGMTRDMIATLPRTSPVSSTDRCAECGHPRAEHSYNGACYGLCGKFVSPIPSKDRGET